MSQRSTFFRLMYWHKTCQISRSMWPFVAAVYCSEHVFTEPVINLVRVFLLPKQPQNYLG